METLWRMTKAGTIIMLAALVAAAMMISIGCSNEEPPPVERTPAERQDTERDDLIEEELDRMREEIISLREEARRTEEKDMAILPSKKAATRTPATRTPRPTSTAAPAPTVAPPPRVSKTDNICMRSPRVQQALINAVKISSCRIITTEELYRISQVELQVSYSTNPKPGDFAGLVNLRTLRVSIREDAETVEIPANTFHGMDNLRNLSISSGTGTTIRRGAFNGLNNLTNLSISMGTPSMPKTLEEGSISLMPALERLDIEIDTPGRIEAGAVQNLPALEYMEIEWRANSGDIIGRNFLGELGNLPSLKQLEIQTQTSYDKNYGPTVRASLFKGMPKLETLRIQGRESNRVTLNEQSFSNNPKLKSLYIRGAISGYKNAFRTLDELEELRLSLDGEGEVALSPNSPLMKAILNGKQRPKGYTVIPPGAD